MNNTNVAPLASILAQAKSLVESNDSIRGSFTCQLLISGYLHSEGCTAQFIVGITSGHSPYKTYSVSGTDLLECTNELIARYMRDLRAEPLLITQSEMPRPSALTAGAPKHDDDECPF